MCVCKILHDIFTNLIPSQLCQIRGFLETFVEITGEFCKRWCSLRVNRSSDFTTCMILGKLSWSISTVKLINRGCVGKVHDMIPHTYGFIHGSCCQYYGHLRDNNFSTCISLCQIIYSVEIPIYSIIIIQNCNWVSTKTKQILFWMLGLKDEWEKKVLLSLISHSGRRKR